MIIKRYKTALKTVQKHNPKPITLLIGDKRYNGVEFKNTTFYGDVRDADGDGYVTWLLINAPEKDIQFLGHDLPDSEGCFHGKDFDLYGETRGTDFIFMGKSEKFQKDAVEWTRKEWKSYANHSIDFEII